MRSCRTTSTSSSTSPSPRSRHSQQHPFQSLLPFPVAGEGHHCANRSRSSAVAPAEVLPGMSYYINDTMSISSDPYALRILGIALCVGLSCGTSSADGLKPHPRLLADDARLQQRGKVIAIEMGAVANADGLAKRRRPHRTVCQPADQVVASAILYEPRVPHAVPCIIKPITISTILCQ